MSRIHDVPGGYAWLESFLNLERGAFIPRQYRLDRMRGLLEAFGRPHLAYRTVHVAGSKGKGSTAAMIASVLQRSGLRCGLYTSPHVIDYRERVRILDESLTDELQIRCFRMIESYVDRIRPSTPEAELPTTFELLTLYGLLCFREAGCDAAAIEVGLGGRLDATNLVLPVASVITPIELEHTDYLGDTLRRIAGEKAGIIKRGVPVFVARQHPDAEAVFVRVAELRRAPITLLERELVEFSPDLGPSGTALSARYSDGTTLDARLRLMGEVQAYNAALAALTVYRTFPAIPASTVREGLEAAWLPGRSELVPGNPPILLDGAHTPASIEQVCRTAERICPDRARRVAIFGAVKGKSHHDMLRRIIGTFPSVIVCRPGTFKESDPQALHALCVSLGGSCRLILEAGDALADARAGSPELIVATGSFYLVGAIRQALAACDPVAAA